MAGNTVLGIDLAAACVVCRDRRWWQGGVAPARRVLADRQTLGEEVGVALQSDQHRVSEAGLLAVHAVAETTLQTFLERVHPCILAAIGRVDGIGAPHRRRARKPAGLEMAVAATQGIANEGSGVLAGIAEDRLAQAHSVAEFVVWNGAVRRGSSGRGLGPRAFRACRCRAAAEPGGAGKASGGQDHQAGENGFPHGVASLVLQARRCDRLADDVKQSLGNPDPAGSDTNRENRLTGRLF